MIFKVQRQNGAINGGKTTCLIYSRQCSRIQGIVIHLFYYEDYAVREIADILKLSESNVKVRLSRGRCLLKKALKEEWDDDK